MAREKSYKWSSLLIFSLIAASLSQGLVISTASLGDQKNFFPSDPHSGGSPPTVPGFHHTPPHGSGGSYGSSPPSHGTPSHGGSPPSNCGTPPSGGTSSSSPPPVVTPTTPSTPTHRSPPTSPPIDPGTPSTPGATVPSPPFAFDPNSPPFPCNFWRTHPTLIWSLFSFSGPTISGAFGLTDGSTPGTVSHSGLEQALSNTRTDGIGALYREGTAALLNSMAIRRFPFTSKQVRDRFVSSLGSNKDAAAQARVFKLANEDQLKPRA